MRLQGRRNRRTRRQTAPSAVPSGQPAPVQRPAADSGKNGKGKKVKYVYVAKTTVLDKVADGESWEPIVPDDVLAVFYKAAVRNQSRETAGMALYDMATNKIIWLAEGKIIAQSNGGVESENGMIIAECLQKFGELPNVQWHTHPDFQPFWSGTDLGDQAEQMENAIKINSAGWRGFIVVGYGVRWRCQAWSWRDHKIAAKHQGFATSEDGVKLGSFPSYTATSSKGAHGGVATIDDDDWNQWGDYYGVYGNYGSYRQQPMPGLISQADKSSYASGPHYQGDWLIDSQGNKFYDPQGAAEERVKRTQEYAVVEAELDMRAKKLIMKQFDIDNEADYERLVHDLFGKTDAPRLIADPQLLLDVLTDVAM